MSKGPLNIKYLGAQVSSEFFTQVKLETVRRGLTMREAVILGVAALLGLDPTNELNEQKVQKFLEGEGESGGNERRS